MKLLRDVVIVLAAAAMVSPVLAQTPEGGDGDFVTDPNDPNVVYRKKTEYDFEDDVVEGAFVRPEGEFLDARRAARHTSLIRIREHFVPEMLKSAEDI